MATTCIAKLFEEFSDWIEYRDRLFTENLATLKKSLSRDWYMPKPDLEATDLSAKRFPVDEIQETYQKTLNGEGLDADIVSTRIQAGLMKSCARAFNLRHTSIPRLLVHGYTENAIETDGVYSTILKDVVSDPIQSANKTRAEKEA